jgi:acetylornithine deacetylase/succinyl-diaminopimelate desuccinylase-like protein
VTRSATIERLRTGFDDGTFLADLARRVAIPTESQDPARAPDLRRYLADEIGPTVAALGYEVTVFDNPVAGAGPFLIARRIESGSLPTVLTYGHADVVRGMDASWSDGRGPWRLEIDGDRIYGRGVADNKGQHSVNLAALAAVIAERGCLGFNSVLLFETGEEVGSPGLHELVAQQRPLLAADVFIASDGPRVEAHRPTLFMGARGALNLELEVRLRDGAHHSGNWGGVLANPGVVLANAIASIIDRHGRVQVRALVPTGVEPSIRAALAGVPIESGPGAPAVDPDWGEPGLVPIERLIAWNTFEVLAFRMGDPDRPVNAIPPTAIAHCQIRYTVDTDPASFVPALREHLDVNGFDQVSVRVSGDAPPWQATRLEPEHPWVRWAAESVERTTGERPALLPNLGGSLPNDAFAVVLGLPTIWVPHSYGACAQHAPDEHALASVLHEGLAIMGGLFWDLGESTPTSEPRDDQHPISAPRSARSPERAG